MPVTNIQDIEKNIQTTIIDRAIIVSCSPGDMTQYNIAIQPITDGVCKWLDEARGGHYVSITGFGESRIRTMFVRQGEHVVWRMVSEVFPGITIGSAYVITLILAHVIHTRYDSEAVYEDSFNQFLSD